MSDRRTQRRSSSIHLTGSSATSTPVSSTPGSRRASIASLPSSQQRLQLSVPPRFRRVNEDEEARNTEKKDSLAWKILSNSQTQSLTELSPEELEKKLAEIMELPRTDIELFQASLLDYYVSGFWWGHEQGFSLQQLSGFFTLLHTLMQNIKEHCMSLDENLTEYKKLLAGVGTDDNDVNGGLDFFDVKQAKCITDFLQATLFQHHKLYEFLFHQERKEEIVGTEDMINVSELLIETLPSADLPYPPPLEEGLEEAIYLSHVATPPSSPKPDEETGEEKGVTEGGDGATTEDAENTSEDPPDVLANVTAEDVKTIFDEVAKELFAGVQSEIQYKLREREGEIISRINKIHRIAET